MEKDSDRTDQTPEETLREVISWGVKFRGRDPANMDAMLTKVCSSIGYLSDQVDVLMENHFRMTEEIDEIRKELGDVLNNRKWGSGDTLPGEGDSALSKDPSNT
jgi:hypothetical protein